VSELSCGYVTVEMGDGAKRQVVAFDLIANDEPLDCWRKIEVPTDDAPDQTRVGDAIESTPSEGIALSDAKDQRQLAWFTEARQFRLARLVELCELVDDLLGEADATKTTDCDCVSGADQPHCLSCQDNLAGIAGACRRDYLSSVHDPPL
jgi:hypothetical protein